MSKEKQRCAHIKKEDVARLYRDDTQTEKRAVRKRKKNGTPISVHKRPIICPPDGAGRGIGVRIAGYVARFLVIAFAVFGFSFFLADAFDFHYVIAVDNNRGQLVDTAFSVTGEIFAAAFLVTAVLMVVCLYRRVRIVFVSVAGVALIACGAGAAIVPSFFEKCLSIPITLVNEMLERLHGVNYLTALPTISGMDAGLSEEFRVKAAGVLLTVLIAAVLVPFMARKIRLLVPAVVVAIVLVFVFVCNIMQSNWAFVFLLASFAAIIVMHTYDRLYAGTPQVDRYDTTVRLVDYGDRPEMPEEIARHNAQIEAKRAEREQKREQKRAKRRKRRANKAVSSVDEELNAYFAAPKPKKVKAEKSAPVRLTSAEKKDARDKQRAEKKAIRMYRVEIRRQVKSVQTYDRVVADSRAAAGGFAGLAAFLLMLLLLFLPAVMVTGKFETISVIDEQLASYREYLTALLVGDEDLLDAIDYERDSRYSSPRSTALTNRYYDGSELFYVSKHSVHNAYLKGWIATDYREGYWYSASEEELEAYRALFDLQDFPAERVTSDFYRYFLADKIDDPLDEEIDWDHDYSYAPGYGTVLEKIHIRRISDALGSLTYLPTVYVSEMGLLEFGSAEKADLHFINYYDGILTGKDFNDATEYAALAYVTTMQDDYFMVRLSERIVEYNVNKTLCTYYRNGYFTDIEVNSDIVVKKTPGGAYTLTAILNEPKCIVTSYYGEDGVLIQTKVNGDKDISLELFTAYISTMTKAEKAALEASFDNYDSYRDFVYDTYLETDIHTEEDSKESYSSAVISDLSDSLAENFSLILEAGVEGSEYETMSYTERHDFLLSILEYMRENYTYLARDEKTLDIIIDTETLVYDDSLDPIENFLTVTKQGYCVQYASALCLLLREQGIPARYVEGYVLDGQRRNYDTWETIYSGTVRDYNLHAWVEVWYDGVGWIQYEATPGEYFYDMYPQPSDDTPSNTDKPDLPLPDTDLDHPDDSQDSTDDEDSLTDEEKLALKEAERRARMLALLKRVGIVLLCLSVVVLIVALVVYFARKAERERDALIASSRKMDRLTEDERRSLALRLIDESASLLQLYGLDPLPGELREEYAARLEGLMPEVFGKAVPNEENNAPPSHAFSYEMDVRAVQMSIAAEEFGNGMTHKELSELSEYYSRLRTQKKRFVSPVRRFFLHYFGHKL